MDFKFSRENTIPVLDFPSRIVEVADTVNMNEWELMVCLPQILIKTAGREYHSGSIENRTDVL